MSNWSTSSATDFAIASGVAGCGVSTRIRPVASPVCKIDDRRLDAAAADVDTDIVCASPSIGDATSVCCHNLRRMSLVSNVIKGSVAERMLLLVHGYGADERDLGGLLPYLDPDGIFATVLPRGPMAAPGTPGFMWYEFGDDGEGYAAALAELDAFVDEQCADLGLDRSAGDLRRLLAGRGPLARARRAEGQSSAARPACSR